MRHLRISKSKTGVVFSTPFPNSTAPSFAVLFFVFFIEIPVIMF